MRNVECVCVINRVNTNRKKASECICACVRMPVLFVDEHGCVRVCVCVGVCVRMPVLCVWALCEKML